VSGPSITITSKWAGSTLRAHSVQLKTPIRDLIAPFFAYLNNYADDEDKGKKTVKGSFFFPALAYPSLKRKEEALLATHDVRSGQSPYEVEHSDDKSAVFRNLRPVTSQGQSRHAQWYYDLFKLDNFLSSEDVAEYAEAEIGVNSYRDLIAPGSTRLFDRAELLGGQYPYADMPPGLQALQVTYDWLNEAIAQQAMITGDSLLQFLNRDGFRDYEAPTISFDALKEPPAQKEKASDKSAALARYLLGHNYIVLENTLRYRMYELMAGNDTKRPGSSASYTWAWNNPDPVYMNHLFGDSMSFNPHLNTPKDSSPTVVGWSYSYKFWDYEPLGLADITKRVETKRLVPGRATVGGLDSC